MKPLLLLLQLALLSLTAGAREWKAYMAYHNATLNCPVDERVYTLADGSLFTYRLGETTVSTFSKATGLSDTNIRYMVYNEEEEAFLLVYSNWNMDVIGINDSITNMPEYKNSNVDDKTVNHVTMNGRYAYVATNSGVVVVNMRRREFANTYNFGKAVKSCASAGGSIMALTAEGIYQGKQSANLIDASNWQRLNNRNLTELIPFDDKLYATATDGLYAVDVSNGNAQRIWSGKIKFAAPYDDRIVMGNASQVITMDGQEKFTTLQWANDFESLSWDGERYWASRGYNGLQAYSVRNDSISPASSPIIPNSPIRNLCYYLDFAPEGRLLVGGGSLNYTYQTYPGTAMMMQDGKWTNFSEDSIVQKTGIPYNNVTAIIQDPEDAGHHYVTAAGGGLYEFRNGTFSYLHSFDNSALETILPSSSRPKYYVRTAGLTFDREGNLWMVNNEVDSILKIYMKDGSWQGFYFNVLDGYPTFDHILLDSRGIAWITHRRTTSVHHAGLLGFYYGGTVKDRSDDVWRFKYQFTNQDNTSYTFNQLYDVKEDRDGQIWVATDKGPFVITQPETFFDDQTVFTQVKVARNDGTDYADYLLSGVPVTTIAIDGGNRKWFGTSGYGVYLVSADGQETLHHFTAENSPLPSNVVYSIAINGTTGEVMIGTDAGLVGYRSDATEPMAELAKSNVKVYPNPVRPTYEGQLRVDGLSFNSDVKITTTTGQVVAQGQSVGGTYTWNLLNRKGERVGTGIYYVIASDEAGNKGAVAKFLVVK
ncbi:MAG: regulator [Bacteroidaceae bacterium]|nr:regulator [Bacteroidaceae bacterium]